MEPAGSVEVTVTHPDGTPLVGANVYTNPNLMLDKSGSQVVGTCYSSMSLIQAKLDDSERRLLEQVVKEYRNSRYYQTTDANGYGMLHDLPINGFPYRLGFSHPEFNAIAKSGTSKSDESDEKPNTIPDLKFELPSAERKIIELVAVLIEKQASNNELAIFKVITYLDSATLIQKRWKFQAILLSERQGASRRFVLELPAASALPLTKVALSNYH